MSSSPVGKVDYVTLLDPESKLLSIPEQSDDTETFAQKFKSFAEVVERGYSLAVNTNFVLTSRGSMNAVDLAVAEMKSKEREFYDAWLKGSVKLFSIDSERDLLPIDAPKSRPKFADRAEVMNQIWKRSDLQPEHAKWMSVVKANCLPLVTALVRIRKAERSLHGGQSVLTPMEMAEYQTCRKLGKLSLMANESGLADKSILSRIARSMEVVRKRQHATKAKLLLSGVQV
ncbi:MAG: hypothetical protein M1814_002903 [Vezdaea aestivalis]|nr:MAG: hypothetical protein M1814_002903 [Vezdaea aestivalis]